MDAARVYLGYLGVVGFALAVGATVFTLWLIIRLDLDALQIILLGTVAFLQIPSLAVLAIRHRQRRARDTRVPMAAG